MQNISLVVLLVGQLWSVDYSMAQACKKTGPCSCKSAKGVVDLSPLKGSPKFKDKGGSMNKYLFSYNPCTPFSEGKGCKKVAACQVSPDKKLQYPTGTQDSAAFSTDKDNNPVIAYTAIDAKGTKRSTMRLTSPHCCPKGGPTPPPSGEGESGGELSLGSILLIVFIALLVVYVAVGVAIQKGIRNATGKEVIPNYVFWSSLPALIKDGTVFTFSKLRGGKGTYDQI